MSLSSRSPPYAANAWRSTADNPARSRIALECVAGSGAVYIAVGDHLGCVGRDRDVLSVEEVGIDRAACVWADGSQDPDPLLPFDYGEVEVGQTGHHRIDASDPPRTDGEWKSCATGKKRNEPMKFSSPPSTDQCQSLSGGSLRIG